MRHAGVDQLPPPAPAARRQHQPRDTAARPEVDPERRRRRAGPARARTPAVITVRPPPTGSGPRKPRRRALGRVGPHGRRGRAGLAPSPSPGAAVLGGAGTDHDAPVGLLALRCRVGCRRWSLSGVVHHLPVGRVHRLQRRGRPVSTPTRPPAGEAAQRLAPAGPVPAHVHGDPYVPTPGSTWRWARSGQLLDGAERGCPWGRRAARGLRPRRRTSMVSSSRSATAVTSPSSAEGVDQAPHEVAAAYVGHLPGRPPRSGPGSSALVHRDLLSGAGAGGPLPRRAPGPLPGAGLRRRPERCSSPLSCSPAVLTTPAVAPVDLGRWGGRAHPGPDPRLPGAVVRRARCEAPPPPRTRHRPRPRRAGRVLTSLASSIVRPVVSTHSTGTSSSAFGQGSCSVPGAGDRAGWLGGRALLRGLGRAGGLGAARSAERRLGAGRLLADVLGVGLAFGGVALAGARPAPSWRRTPRPVAGGLGRLGVWLAGAGGLTGRDGVRVLR